MKIENKSMKELIDGGPSRVKEKIAQALDAMEGLRLEIEDQRHQLELSQPATTSYLDRLRVAADQVIGHEDALFRMANELGAGRKGVT